jgi:hypothetical protein
LAFQRARTFSGREQPKESVCPGVFGFWRFRGPGIFWAANREKKVCVLTFSPGFWRFRGPGFFRAANREKKVCVLAFLRNGLGKGAVFSVKK